MSNVGKRMDEAGGILNKLFTLGFLGLIWLIIYGNLSGNLGFAANTAGANNTTAVIGALTTGAQSFFSFSTTLFTITGVVLLITILIGALNIVVGMVGKKQNNGFE